MEPDPAALTRRVKVALPTSVAPGQTITAKLADGTHFNFVAPPWAAAGLSVEIDIPAPPQPQPALPPPPVAPLPDAPPTAPPAASAFTMAMPSLQPNLAVPMAAPPIPLNHADVGGTNGPQPQTGDNSAAASASRRQPARAMRMPKRYATDDTPSATAAPTAASTAAAAKPRTPSSSLSSPPAALPPAVAATPPPPTETHLIHGDCVAGMLAALGASSVDLVIADPPYNIAVQGSEWDTVPNYLAWCRTWLLECVRVLRPGGSLFLYGSPAKLWICHLKLLAAELGMDFKQHISWVYKQGGDSRLRGMTQYSVRMEHLEWFVKPGGSHTFNVDEATEAYTEAEFAEALAKGCGRVTAESLQRGRPPRNWWDIPRENSRSKERQYGLHPSMKPLKICERLVLVHSNPGDTVVVPFGGSGSECVSTAALGRTLYAYETCDEYYQIILRRMHGHGLLPSGYPVPPPLVKGGARGGRGGRRRLADDGGARRRRRSGRGVARRRRRCRRGRRRARRSDDAAATADRRWCATPGTRPATWGCTSTARSGSPR